MVHSDRCSRKGTHYCVNGIVTSIITNLVDSVAHLRLYCRSELVGHAIEFSEFDFLESPEPLRPYMISPWGHILEFRGQTESWARNPKEVSGTRHALYLFLYYSLPPDKASPCWHADRRRRHHTHRYRA